MTRLLPFFFLSIYGTAAASNPPTVDLGYAVYEGSLQEVYEETLHVGMLLTNESERGHLIYTTFRTSDMAHRQPVNCVCMSRPSFCHFCPVLICCYLLKLMLI